MPPKKLVTVAETSVSDLDAIQVEPGATTDDGTPVDGIFELVSEADLAVVPAPGQSSAVLVAVRVRGRSSSLLWIRPRRWRVRRGYVGPVVDELALASEGG